MKIQVPAAEAEVYLMYSRNREETSEHVCSVVVGGGCYISWTLKTTVKSLIFILIEEGNQLLFRLLSIKKNQAPYSYMCKF